MLTINSFVDYFLTEIEVWSKERQKMSISVSQIPRRSVLKCVLYSKIFTLLSKRSKENRKYPNVRKWIQGILAFIVHFF